VSEETEKRKLARERLKRLRAARAQRLKEERARAKAQKDNAAAKPAVTHEAKASLASAAKDRQKMRQLEINALERDVAALSGLTDPSDAGAVEIERIRQEVDELKRDFYAHLDAWQKLQLARHPQRPYTEDFIRLLFENFSEIHGDRHYADDPALLTGMAWYHGKPVMVIGSQKGRDTKQRLARNFGQAKPEGYRKALRAMQLAAKYGRPILVFIDTPGAYPGVDAEERGQAEAIALNLREMSRMAVPIIVTITGEGGSGGALATAVGDRIFMLENSVYSVISPEGCATIMWRDSTKAELAAEALKITATDLLEMKLIDDIVPEPDGGAHTDHAATARLLDPVLANSLQELSALPPQQLVEQRYEKFRRMGQFFA
jgi:acetyl-CoA carboxylase carboxyl transferase subunit alpha